MLNILKTEFLKLKRLHILLIGFIGMALPSILAEFTQAVSSREAKIQNFDFYALFNSTIWNSATIFMPIIFTLIGGYIINREYTDHTLKSILPIPVTIQHLLFGKLLTMGILGVLFGFYSFVVTLFVGFLSGVPGLTVSILLKSLLQMIGIAFCTYIAILPIIAFTSKKQNIFMGGVIVSFILGYCAMFIKNVTLRSLYPILAGFTILKFDTKTFMNTSQPANITLSVLSLAVTLFIALIIVTLINPSHASSKNKISKSANIFLRKGQNSN